MKEKGRKRVGKEMRTTKSRMTRSFQGIRMMENHVQRITNDEKRSATMDVLRLKRSEDTLQHSI